MDSTYSEKTEIAVVRYIDKMTAVQSFESCVMKSISPVSLARSAFGKFKGINYNCHRNFQVFWAELFFKTILVIKEYLCTVSSASILLISGFLEATIHKVVYKKAVSKNFTKCWKKIVNNFFKIKFQGDWFCLPVKDCATENFWEILHSYWRNHSLENLRRSCFGFLNAVFWKMSS